MLVTTLLMREYLQVEGRRCDGQISIDFNSDLNRAADLTILVPEESVGACRYHRGHHGHQCGAGRRFGLCDVVHEASARMGREQQQWMEHTTLGDGENMIVGLSSICPSIRPTISLRANFHMENTQRRRACKMQI